MSGQGSRDAHNSAKITDDNHPSRGRLNGNPNQRVFLVNRRHTSRDSDDRRTKKENSTDNAVASSSTQRRRKAAIRDRGDRPDSPIPDRHPPRSSLHHPLVYRPRTNKQTALVRKQGNDTNHSSRLQHPRKPQGNSNVIATTDDDRPSRPATRTNFGTARDLRSTSRASTLYERVSRRSSESLGEIDNLREQVTKLRKEAEEARQASTDKQKVIDELTAELTAQKKLNKKQATQLETLVKSEKKNEELMSTIQTNLQCQICWEMFTRPHVLTPCGHVYCMQCLQDWFRSGPALSDDDENEAHRLSIFRKKHCPCCRTRILLRPVEIFLVKSMTAAFNSANNQTVQTTPGTAEAPAPTPQSPSTGPTTAGPVAAAAPASAGTEPIDETDPWAGLFPVHNIVAGYIEELDDGEGGLDEYESDSQLRSETSSMAFYHTDEDPFYSDAGDSHSASDHEDVDEERDIEHDIEALDNISVSDDMDLLYRQQYVRPPYAPPIYSRGTVLNEYPNAYGENLELLQRGATLLMIDRYDMRFDRQHGISLRLPGGNKMYVGWNITRPHIHSLDGSELVERLEYDLYDNQERWEVVHVGAAVFIAWRLVPEDESGVAIPEVVGMSDDED